MGTSQKPSRRQNMSPQGSSSSDSKTIHIGEEVKIAVNLSLERFRYSDEKEMEFPSSLSSTERAFIHRLAQSLGYISKSKGGFDRNRASGRLNNGIPMVPRKRAPSELDIFRSSLPVHEHQEEIVRLIRENRVVLVLGETGSGKTTQIPQFLLDDCSRNGKPCRIFCTQPRRLAAIAVAERVAAERGESVGQTVGYHIRLESRVSPKTLLTFCTSGVLLRTLMAGDTSLTTVTHVIVDEVHERDGLTDFLLTKMRDVVQRIPTLKLILSSAALDIDLFLQYFGSCPVIHPVSNVVAESVSPTADVVNVSRVRSLLGRAVLKGKLFEVKELFLEDILRQTGFNRKDIWKYQEETQRKEGKQKRLTEWCETVESGSVGGKRTHMLAPGFLHAGSCGDREDEGSIKLASQTHNIIHYEASTTHILSPLLQDLMIVNENDTEQLEPWLLREMDSCISSIFLHEDQEAFSQLFNLILNESVPVDFMHSETGSTALMVSAARGFLPQMQQLLSMGADINMKASNGTALDFAKHFQQTEAMDILKSSIPLGEVSSLEESALVQCSHTELSSEEQELLKQYHHSFDDQRVDLDLIMTLLHNICTTTNEGREYWQCHFPCPGASAVLVFLPGYDEIVSLRDRILFDDKRFSTHSESYQVFTLHSDMQTLDQKRAMKPAPSGVRKITKLLAPSSCPVAEFLSKAPQPPPTHAIQSAVQMLKTIDALDQNEDLTDLGFHLADLPVEPHLGKMVLCAVVLKCLDPILTIACTLAYRDPFTLPAESSQKRAALQSRKRFTSNTFSDHMALLRAFQAWQKARSEGWERSFCERNFLSQSTMDMILGMRTQLLGQLRAIGFVRARGGSDIRDVNLNSENWAVVKAALVAGMYPNMVHVNKKTSLLSSNREKKVHFHPTSVLSQLQLKENNSSKSGQTLPTDWLIYDEMSRGHRMASVRCCSVVTSITVAMFGGGTKLLSSTLHESAVQKRNENPLDDMSDSDTEDLVEIKIDDWLVFGLERETAALVSELRQKWQNLFIKRIRCPSKPWSQQDEAVIQTLVSVRVHADCLQVLGAEEQEAGLQQPTGIGQRPRPMTSEDGPRSSGRNSKASPQLPSHNTNDNLLLMTGDLSRVNPASRPGRSWRWAPATLPTPLGKKGVQIMDGWMCKGYARMTSVVSQESCQDWGFMGLGGVFSVEWIHKESLPFPFTQHILNPWNDNKRVQVSRDGQTSYKLHYRTVVTATASAWLGSAEV
ncbi:hypothetical protein CCH79_00018160 [Gambusia affinis]|uniref:RNA helicase n=1 Tax=Gambusia affinis TaxID=33528 RepID=A0A315W3L4_GAMAF|nr:hypothetical protein CCH79_00018160 [Gambusia affinis]